MGKKSESPRKKPGWAAMKKWMDNSIAATAGAVGIFLREAGGTTSYRERASMAIQRYVGVGLDGSVDAGVALNNWMGIAHRWVDQRIKTRLSYFRMVAARKALPIAAETMPILFAMDAGRGITDATDKLQAYHTCYNQTLDGYNPDTGVYDGLAEPKNLAYELASYASLFGSKVVSEVAPDINYSISKFTGGLLRGL